MSLLYRHYLNQKQKCDGATDLTGDLVVKSVIEKSFGAFKKYSENKNWILISGKAALDFAISSECFACKCQDCKVKHDGVINAINSLTASIKKMISKRGVIPSKGISYPDTPLKIKADKRRKKDTSKASSSIKKTRFIPTGLPWHLVDEVYILINCGDEFHWVLAIVVLKERSIRVYDSMSRRRCFGPLSKIQKLAKILPIYLDMSGFLDQKVRTDWSMVEAYWDKMDNPFDVQYVEGICQQIIGSLYAKNQKSNKGSEEV
ncbi:hypothetical protein BC332_25967 [Capsicum chinense]|nr:hypothetical protein BC332_25967 [Capsicum chinense]